MPSPLAYFDVSGRESSSQVGTSKLNHAEAWVVVQLAERLLTDVAPTDIGIITPYNAQASLIRRALHSRGVPADLEVRTVDGFQGREKEVILFSAVRANKMGQLGFVTDARR